MREPEYYRPILETINQTTNKRILSQSDVARYLNKSRGWTRDKLGISKDGITAEALAWKLASEFA